MSAPSHLEESTTDHLLLLADHRPLWNLLPREHRVLDGARLAQDGCLHAAERAAAHRGRRWPRRSESLERPAETLLITAVALGLARIEAGRYSVTSEGQVSLLAISPTYFGGFLDAWLPADAERVRRYEAGPTLADAP